VHDDHVSFGGGPNATLPAPTPQTVQSCSPNLSTRISLGRMLRKMPLSSSTRTRSRKVPHRADRHRWPWGRSWFRKLRDWCFMIRDWCFMVPMGTGYSPILAVPLRGLTLLPLEDHAVLVDLPGECAEDAVSRAVSLPVLVPFPHAGLLPDRPECGHRVHRVRGPRHQRRPSEPSAATLG
jgi:hypothetical protein